jgi:hypothetical protein
LWRRIGGPRHSQAVVAKAEVDVEESVDVRFVAGVLPRLMAPPARPQAQCDSRWPAASHGPS